MSPSPETLFLWLTELPHDIWHNHFLFYLIVLGISVLQKSKGVFCLIFDVIKSEFIQLLLEKTQQRGCARLGTPQKCTLRRSARQLKSPAGHWNEFYSHVETDIAIRLKWISRAEIACKLQLKCCNSSYFKATTDLQQHIDLLIQPSFL